MTQADTRHDATPAGGGDASNTMRALSQEMVRLYKEQFGRGPTTAYSHHVGADMVVSVLGGSLTPVERSMIAMGEEQRLRDIRDMFQHATEDKFRAAAEQVTGRTVTAFMSGIDVDADLACEVFVLAPVRS
jgi:uncharacterized protein YbcI